MDIKSKISTIFKTEDRKFLPIDGFVLVEPEGIIEGQAVDYELPYDEFYDKYGRVICRPWFGGECSDKGVFIEGRKVELSPYCIGKTAVTYGLWKEVYDWAIENGYTFRNSGGGESEKHPATFISWMDCVVWCNAYTEKYYGESTECVYMSSEEKDAIILRNSKEEIACDAFADINKKGFRLPTDAEWEFAARWQRDNSNKNAVKYGKDWLTKLDSASGASANWKDERATGEVGWFSGNSDEKSHEVGQKKVNAFGLYDMSGNIWEFCFDKYHGFVTDPTYDDWRYIISGVVKNPQGSDIGTTRIIRGGSWSSAKWSDNSMSCTVGSRGDLLPSYVDDLYGFRLAYNAFTD